MSFSGTSLFNTCSFLVRHYLIHLIISCISFSVYSKTCTIIRLLPPLVCIHSHLWYFLHIIISYALSSVWSKSCWSDGASFWLLLYFYYIIISHILLYHFFSIFMSNLLFFARYLMYSQKYTSSSRQWF